MAQSLGKRAMDRPEPWPVLKNVIHYRIKWAGFFAPQQAWWNRLSRIRSRKGSLSLFTAPTPCRGLSFDMADNDEFDGDKYVVTNEEECLSLRREQVEAD
jgi:hypothetical protein